jgi:hypothetical protein
MPEICKNCKKLPWAKLAKRRCICHGCNLDIGCGNNKQKGFLGVDKKELVGVDLVVDIETTPWPFPRSIVNKMLCSHSLSYIKPWLFIDVMDEMWEMIHPDGQLLVIVPYAGSFGFYQDPLRTKGYNEATFSYFDPDHKSGLYQIYQPKPWHIVRHHWSPLHNIEIILEPRNKN